MQEETNKKINDFHQDIHRIEKILISSTAFLMTSMLGIIVALILNLNYMTLCVLLVKIIHFVLPM